MVRVGCRVAIPHTESPPFKNSDLLKTAQEAFDLCAEREEANRAAALDDIRFARLAEQWPEHVKRAREVEGRPCLTINRLPAFIRQVVNDARQNSPSIIVHPVDSFADPATAEIINGLIRNIEAASDADVAYDTALESAVTGGFGYFRINLAYADDDSFDKDIRIRRIANPFSVYGDPTSTAADSADWNTAFVVDTMSKAAFEKKYKGAEAVDWTSDGYGGLRSPWLDGDQVMVAEYWTREEAPRAIVALSSGEVVALETYEANKDRFDALNLSVVGAPRLVKSHKVKQRILTGADVLETVDWAGKYIPLVPKSMARTSIWRASGICACHGAGRQGPAADVQLLAHGGDRAGGAGAQGALDRPRGAFKSRCGQMGHRLSPEPRPYRI